MSKEKRQLQYIFPKATTINTGNKIFCFFLALLGRAAQRCAALRSAAQRCAALRSAAHTKIEPNNNCTSIIIREDFKASLIG
jgi:hypothetical protein